MPANEPKLRAEMGLGVKHTPKHFMHRRPASAFNVRSAHVREIYMHLHNPLQSTVALQFRFDVRFANVHLAEACPALMHTASTGLTCASLCQRPSVPAHSAFQPSAKPVKTFVTAPASPVSTTIKRDRPACITAAAQQAHVGAMPDGVEPASERVTFQDDTGTELVGILTLPESADVAVLCHGYTSSKDGMHLAATAERLAASSMATLRHGACTSRGAPRY